MASKDELAKLMYRDLQQIIRNEQKVYTMPLTIQNEAEFMVKNGLSESILGFNPFNIGSIGTQLSQVDTLFRNNRWYLVSNMRQLLSEIYVEHGLVQTIVDVPVDDGLRGGVEIKSKQLSEEQVQELEVSLDRDDDLNTTGQALKWNRLYGGAGVLIMTDQDPESPLNIDAIRKDSPLEFRAVDMWELFWDKQNMEGYDPEIQEQGFEFYNYYAKKLHKSRVMRMKGLTAPSFIRPRLRGWGFSVVEALVRSINQYLKANDLSFEVLDEFKLDIFKIKNLTSTLLSPNGEAKVRQRVQLANHQKNFQNAITMDSEDDYVQKQLSFAGLGDAMIGIRMQIASDMRMPLTKLFGISAAGFNSGQDDIEVYNSMVESQVRNKVKYDLLRLIEIKCQKLFEFVPDDLSIEFKPLRVLSAEQEENVKTQQFNRLLALKTINEINSLELRHAINKNNLVPLALETEHLSLPDADSADEQREDPTEQTDIRDPGANREDIRKPQITKGTTPATIPPDPEPKDMRPAKNAIDVEGVDLEMLFSTMLPNFKPLTKENSIEYDVASWKADGGDDIMPPGRIKLFENPGNVDEALWMKAKEASKKAFGEVKYGFVTWWYKKRGGKFT